MVVAQPGSTRCVILEEVGVYYGRPRPNSSTLSERRQFRSTMRDSVQAVRVGQQGGPGTPASGSATAHAGVGHLDLGPLARDIELLEQVLHHLSHIAVPHKQPGDDAVHGYPPLA